MQPRVEQHQAQARAERGADPERAVDREVDGAAHARGNQLVDRRVDRRVLAADAEAGEEAAERERSEVPGERGEHRRDEIDRERDEEQALAAEPVGEPAEHERAEHRARRYTPSPPSRRRAAVRPSVSGRCSTAPSEPTTVTSSPSSSQVTPSAMHHAPVPARPRQGVEPRRDGAGNGRSDAHGGIRYCSERAGVGEFPGKRLIFKLAS